MVNNADALTFTRHMHALTNTLAFSESTSERSGRGNNRSDETRAGKSRKTMMSDELQGRSPERCFSLLAPSSPAWVDGINAEKLNATKLEGAS